MYILQTLLLALVGQSIFAYIIHIEKGIKSKKLDPQTVTVKSFFSYLNDSSLKIGILSVTILVIAYLLKM